MNQIMSFKITLKSILLVVSLFFSLTVFANVNTPFSERTEVNELLEDIARKHHYDKDTLRNYFNLVELRQDIINAISHPAEAKPWYFYRGFFVNDANRIKGGLAFWEKYTDTLARAEREFGVPAQYIVAILGIETMYGKHMGQYRVLDSLATLAFMHTPRAPFFRSELSEFFLLLRENQLDPTTIYGSYAGAMGQAQFMPSSYRRFAISADGNPSVDLMHNSDDAILSIANYLHKNGWAPNQPVAFKTKVAGKQFQEVVAKPRKYQPIQTQASLKSFNIKPADDMPLESKAVLIELQKDRRHKEYWLGFQNFYAITRYNPSANYAMAVFQLGNKLNDFRNSKKNA